MYQGYTNFPTYVVALWLSNDAERNAYLYELANSTKEDKVVTLKEYVEKERDKTITSTMEIRILHNAWFITDILNNALEVETNYLEILENAKEDTI